MRTTEKLLTTAEAAGRLRLSEARVYRLVREGRLPAQRLRPRGKLLFDARDVEAALRQARPAPAAS